MIERGDQACVHEACNERTIHFEDIGHVTRSRRDTEALGILLIGEEAQLDRSSLRAHGALVGRDDTAHGSFLGLLSVMRPDPQARRERSRPAAVSDESSLHTPNMLHPAEIAAAATPSIQTRRPKESLARAHDTGRR